MITIEAGHDGISVIRLDDGALNTLDADRFRALQDALERTAPDPVVIAGRADVFTAGLNTKTLAGLGDSGFRDLMTVFAQTTMRTWLEPRPVVVAATGHAVAAGTILAMAADHTVAAEGDYRWGLTETAIGFCLPQFALTLAAHHVRADRRDELLLAGGTLTPAQAVEVGFAQASAPADETEHRALARAADLAALPRAAFAEQKRRLRGPAQQAVLDGLADDTAALARWWGDRPPDRT